MQQERNESLERPVQIDATVDQATARHIIHAWAGEPVGESTETILLARERRGRVAFILAAANAIAIAGLFLIAPNNIEQQVVGLLAGCGVYAVTASALRFARARSTTVNSWFTRTVPLEDHSPGDVS